ncbi:DNA topoisomerase 6 subunit B-like isoform X2 [Tripterygium wilfordii]|uniref:DNA topoisomerase 6 subunit B-like isoform X2 n=1 Tax=Tripterygium wilfordii TaxID=458696 RepID=UPI0018F858E5|nr:DNA topoisomerase 6 subunit B-like isoform X2 [Tripterygium wilfordii]
MAKECHTMTSQICLDEVCKFLTGVKLHLQRVETVVYLFMLRNYFGMVKGRFNDIYHAVLSGTKYGLKQTRGKFGLGAKMALIWSKMSTGLPIEISSAMEGQNYISFCRLDIDIHRNIPNVHIHEKRDNKDRWHGAEIQVVIEGNWTTYRSKILHYMRQMAVITPYAQFLFKFVSETPDKNVTIRFARRTDVMPPVPLETKHHPSSVDLLLIKRLIAETSKQNLLQFLQHEFVNIRKSLAERLIGEMGPEFSPKMPVKSLTSQQIVRIHQLFRQAKFDDPTGDCLSPAGEYNLRLGIIKELHPDMVATYSGSAHVFEGHPFIVEAGLSVGGKDVKQGLNIFRFANRIPLLFEQGADVVTRTALKRINWSSYKINPMQDKVGVFVSVVSTKIPFKGTGKEYIGDDISEIASAVKSAIQQCCIQLKSKIVKKMQAREQQERKRNLSRYIPDATGAIYDVLKEMAQLHGSKKKKYEDGVVEVLNKVSARLITKESLAEKLAQHVEQVDYEMALEYATQSGVTEEPREDVYIQSLGVQNKFIDLHSPLFVFRLLQ